jgi:hypothetical protein
LQIAVTSSAYILIPVDGPEGVDLTQFPVKVAIIDERAGEPADADWKVGVWIEGEAGWLKPKNGLAAGSYMAWVMVDAGDEQPVEQSGRIRVGDGGS